MSIQYHLCLEEKAMLDVIRGDKNIWSQGNGGFCPYILKYESPGGGRGGAGSSREIVLNAARDIYFRDGPPVLEDDVARLALARERREAGLPIAADDVYPIVFGGVVTVTTRPMCGQRETISSEDIEIEPVNVRHKWLAERVVLAHDESAEPHHAPDLLKHLFSSRSAPDYISRISKLADTASKAISNEDIETLAAQITEYVRLFDEWSNGRYTQYSCGKALELKDRLGDDFLAWKPPGAGGTKSIGAFVRHKPALRRAKSFFEANGWSAMPLLVTSGLCAEYIRSDGSVRFSAGSRFDFIGLADCGQEIGAAGKCCACAHEPRSFLTIQHGAY